MEAEVGEFEEEELVDFEGSDYSIGFDDEYGDEEEIRGPSTSRRAEDILLEQVQKSKLFETQIIHPNCPREMICYSAETVKVEGRDNESKCPNSRHSVSQEGAESGEIEEEKDEREDGAISQPVFSFDKNLGNNILQGRAGKHFKTDLEDGELDDAAMVMPYSCSQIFHPRSEFLAARSPSVKNSCLPSHSPLFFLLRSLFPNLAVIYHPLGPSCGVHLILADQ